MNKKVVVFCLKLFLLFSVLSFFSACSNFLQGANLSQEINDVVDYYSCKEPLVVLSFTPKNEPNGVYANTPISIKFNRYVPKEAFYDGTTPLYKIETSDKVDITSYFDSPITYSNNEEKNFAVVFYPKKEKISELIASVSYRDINVILSKNITVNSAKLSLQDEVYSYRINNRSDYEEPVITDFYIAKTKDNILHKENLFTQKKLEEWENADFNLNHTKSLHIYIEGYDEGEGVNSVKIKETLLYLKDGTVPSGEVEYETICGENNFANCEILNSRRAVFEYNFKNKFDGIVKLEFSVLDDCGNESKKALNKTCYVIKDTVVSSEYLKIYNQYGYSDPENKTFKLADINESLRKIYVNATELYQIYNNEKHISDDLQIKFFAGNDKENLKEYKMQADSNGTYYYIDSLEKDSDTVLKLDVTDSAGNRESFYRYIPRTGKFVTYIYSSIVGSSDGQFTFTFPSNLSSEDGMTYKKQGLYSIDDSDSSYSYMNDNTHDAVTMSGIKSIGENHTYNFCYICFNEYGPGDNSEYRLYGAVGNILKAVCRYPERGGSSALDYDVVLTPGPVNSGIYYAKITYKTEPEQGFFYFMRYSTNKNLITYNNGGDIYEGTEFEIKPYNNSKVYFRSLAVDEQGNISDGVVKEFEISVDVLGPSLTDMWPDTLSNGEGLYTSEASDKSGFLTDENGNVKIDYWFVPEQKEWYDSLNNSLNYSESFVSQYKKHTVYVNAERMAETESVPFYYDGTPAGIYVPYAKVYDTVGNFRFCPIGYSQISMLEQVPDYSWNGSAFSINFSNSEKEIKEDNHLVSIEYFDEDNKKWVYKYYDEDKYITAVDVFDDNLERKYLGKDGKFSSAVETNKFIKAVVTWNGNVDNLFSGYAYVGIPAKSFYFYSDSDPQNNKCTIKKADSLTDSMIIANSNQPYIVQTLSSSINYGDDVAKWERYGIRQNPEMFTGTDYYTIDKENIDDGYYYCAIVHFADGEGKVVKVYKK